MPPFFPMNIIPRFLAPVLGLLTLAGCQTQTSAPMQAKLADLEAKVTRLENDWAQLARYRAANAALPAPAATAARVVFMGDSITDSWPGIGTYFSRHPYVGRGISGQTTPQMLIRFQPDVIALQPRVVVILAGTNDIAGNTGPYDPALTHDCLASMVELAQQHGIRVVLASVLPAYDYPWRPGLQPAPKIVALNVWLKDFAVRHGCTYLDYFTAMADERAGLPLAYSQDGVHPNTAGYAVMERLAEEAIASALARK